jgi:nitrogen-specific signal transduction histidine kinase
MITDQDAFVSSPLETLGKIAPAIAHDINNLLSGILGYSQIIISDPSAGHLIAYAEEINKASKRIAAIIRWLQAFNPGQSPQEELLDINGILQELEKYVPRILGENILLFFQKNPKLRQIRADKIRIRQVFLLWFALLRNLLPQGGRILVETEPSVSAMESQADQHREIVIRANILSPIPFPQSLSYPPGITENASFNLTTILPLCGGRTTCIRQNETSLYVLLYFPAELPASED